MSLSINIVSEASCQAVPTFNIGRGRDRGRGRGRGRAATGRGIGRGVAGRGRIGERATTVERRLIRIERPHRIFKDDCIERILSNKLTLAVVIGILEAKEGSMLAVATALTLMQMGTEIRIDKRVTIV